MQNETTQSLDQPSQFTEEAWPNPRYAWFVVIILTGAYTLSFIDRQIISLLVGPIQADLKITDFEMSLLQGFAFALFYTIIGLPLGRLADRTNRRWLVAIGVFFWSLMTMACGLAKSYSMLFLARMGVGIGEATISPCSYSIISDYFPREKLSRAISVYFMGVYLGAGLAYIVGGFVIDMVSGMDKISLPMVGDISAWQVTFLAVGAPGLLYAFIIFLIKEPKRRGLITQEVKDSKGEKKSSNEVTLTMAFKFMFARWRFYILLSTALGFHALLGYGTGSWAPEYFIRTFAVDRSDLAYLYGTIVLIFATSGVYFGGWLADILNSRGHKDGQIKAIIIGLIASMPLTMIFPLIDDYNLAMVVFAASAFVMGFPYGVGAAAIQVVTPNQMRGLVSAVFLFLINIIGMGLGPTVVASFTDFVFMDQYKLGYSLVATAAFALPISLIMVLACRKTFLECLEQSNEWAGKSQVKSQVK